MDYTFPLPLSSTTFIRSSRNVVCLLTLESQTLLRRGERFEQFPFSGKVCLRILKLSFLTYRMIVCNTQTNLKMIRLD